MHSRAPESDTGEAVDEGDLVVVDIRQGPGGSGVRTPVDPVAGQLVPPARVPAVRPVRHRSLLPALVVLGAELLAALCAVAVVGSVWTDAALVVGTGLVLLAASGLFRHRLTLSALDDLPVVLSRLVIAGGVTVVVLLVAPPEVGRERMLSALWVAGLWAGFGLPLRTAAYAVVRRLRRRPGQRSVLIVGTGLIAGRIATILDEHPEYGMTPIGFVDDHPLSDPDRTLPVLGRLSDISTVIEERQVSDVVVTFTSLPESQLVSLIRSCDRLDCELYVVPRLFELYHRPVATQYLWGIPLSHIPRPAFRSATARLKRPLDATLAALAVVALLPVMAVCALAARRETGNVLFRQERVGRDGRPIEVLKFQTLKPADPQEADTTWSVALDSRLGRCGRFMRRTSLDELPQLWNVVRGDMSLVGPRPERPHFARAFGAQFPQYDARSRVPVGLTGWAQIHQLRGDTSVDDRAFFDNYYIEHWSLWGDIKIMLRTVPSVLRGAGG